jgi:hypothetical protein
MAGNTSEPSAEEGGAPDPRKVVTVTNPPQTVSVSVFPGGRIDEVVLSPQVKNMKESDLAGEIFVIANLAWQTGRAARHSYLSERLRRSGNYDEDHITEFVEEQMGLPSPAKAAAMRAQVFTTRYGSASD